MKIKNILVTGASGRIGRNLVPELVKAGYQVRAVQFETPVTFEDVEVFKASVADINFAKKALEDMDAVIHLAHVKENREKFMDTCIRGSFELLDEANKCGHIKQFIQAGSDARAGIYFYPRPFPIDETFPHAAYPGYYAFSKVLEEVMCEQFVIQYNTPITVLRFSWVHLEDDILAHITLKEPGFGIPIWKELAKKPEQKEYFEKGIDGIALLQHTNGQPGIRHIVSVKDVVQGIMKSIGNKAALGQAFTITAASPFSYEVLAKYVSEKLNLPIVEFQHDGFYDFSHCIAKARSILGYKPEYDIFKIIDAAIEFRKSGQKRSPLKYIG